MNDPNFLRTVSNDVAENFLANSISMASILYSLRKPENKGLNSIFSLKIPQNHEFSGILRGYEMTPLARNGLRSYLMHCAIWYHLHNLKNVKNNHGGV